MGASAGEPSKHSVVRVPVPVTKKAMALFAAQSGRLTISWTMVFKFGVRCLTVASCNTVQETGDHATEAVVFARLEILAFVEVKVDGLPRF